jgi:hypothetical protein
MKMKRGIEARATTSSGPRTRAYILDQEFERGVKEDLPLPEDFPLERAAILPEWNY